MHLVRKIKNLSLFWIVAFLIVVFLSFLNFNRLSSQTMVASSGSCSLISITGTTTLSGIASIDVNILSTNTKQIEKIIIFASNSANAKRIIGRAQVASTNKWTFKWATALWPSPNSSVKLSAEVFYLGSSSSCTVDSTDQLSLGNSLQTTMTVTLVGQIGSASVGSTYDYEVRAKINDASFNSFDLTQYSILEWSQATNIGFLSSNNFPNDTQVKFNTGQIPGDNTISVRVIYGGTDTTKSIPLTIKPLVTTPNSTNSTTSTTTPAPTTKNQTPATTVSVSTDTASTTQLTSSQVQVTPVTKSCVEAALSTKRYTEIYNGNSRPTINELTKIATCFAPSKYILPSNFSPIDPLKVSNLEVSENVTVSNLENVTKKVDSKDKQMLKITGKTTPNSTVVLYVYSDPLVITTKSDGDGNWQYTIEDPLEPGKHEVYAIVDNGDGVYKRSDPMSFLISTASASAANPKGLSLKLSEPPKKTPTQSSINLIIYVAGSIAVLAVALVGLYLIVRSHHKHKVIIAEINKKSEIDNSACPHCNNLIGDIKKTDVENNPVNLVE